MMCGLKKKFGEWNEWLFGDDMHSIQRQIHKMIWDMAVFLAINKIRGLAPVDENGNPQLNPTVHTLINNSFFETQMLAIRKFLESKRFMWSLWRLIQDIENYHDSLTRENILAAHGFPYDYEAEKRALLESEAHNGSAHWLGPGLVKCTHSEHVHNSIDLLSGVTSNNRQPGDKVRKRIFKFLKQKLEVCDQMCDYVNNFIAHCPKPESGERIKANDIKITLGKIQDVHKTICETATFIGRNILYRGFGNFVAIPQYDQFAHFEKPWASEDTVKKLRKSWHEYDQKTREWENWDWQEEYREFLGSN